MARKRNKSEEGKGDKRKKKRERRRENEGGRSDVNETKDEKGGKSKRWKDVM